jgi:hypothetical protein
MALTEFLRPSIITPLTRVLEDGYGNRTVIEVEDTPTCRPISAKTSVERPRSLIKKRGVRRPRDQAPQSLWFVVLNELYESFRYFKSGSWQAVCRAVRKLQLASCV